MPPMYGRQRRQFRINGVIGGRLVCHAECPRLIILPRGWVVQPTASQYDRQPSY